LKNAWAVARVYAAAAGIAKEAAFAALFVDESVDQILAQSDNNILQSICYLDFNKPF